MSRASKIHFLLVYIPNRLSHKLLGNFSATFEIFSNFLEFSATLGFLRFFVACAAGLTSQIQKYDHVITILVTTLNCFPLKQNSPMSLSRLGCTFCQGKALSKDLRSAIIDVIVENGRDYTCGLFMANYSDIGRRFNVSGQTVKNLWVKLALKTKRDLKILPI